MIYLDTSAFVKLVWTEPETDALARFITQQASMPLVSSSLLAIEARRTVQRENPSALPRADLLLTGSAGSASPQTSSNPQAGLRTARWTRSISLPRWSCVTAFVIVRCHKRLTTVAEAHHLLVESPGVANR